MDDLGNIVYVVIAIGWFFWNAYKKSQEGKAKQPASAKPSTARKNDSDSGGDTFKSLEDFIRGQFEEESELVHEAVKPEPAAHKNQDKFLSSDLKHSHLADDYQMSVGDSKSHRVQRQVKPLKVVEVEEEEALMDELFPDGFNLKKAVVLNAILERPYT